MAEIDRRGLEALKRRVDIIVGRRLTQYKAGVDKSTDQFRLKQERGAVETLLRTLMKPGVECECSFEVKEDGINSRFEVTIPDWFLVTVETPAEERVAMGYLANIVTKMVLSAGKKFLLDRRLEEFSVLT